MITWCTYDHIWCAVDGQTDRRTDDGQMEEVRYEVSVAPKNSNKEKYVCSGYRIIFESSGSWHFDDDFARNVIIFYVDSILWCHSDNHKNNFDILVEGPNFGFNGSFESPEKKLIIKFT